jgi:hypothetical protein
MKLWIALVLSLLLSACAAYSGYGLKTGVDRADDVVRTMGEPAMRWLDPDGSAQFAYPRGPMGYQTYMVFVGADDKLQSIRNVLNEKDFARIQAGMTKDEVLRVLGPPFEGWTSTSLSRNELSWEWRYCDAWSEAARFYVLFDINKAIVTKTLSHTESLLGLWGKGNHICSN